jgi:hypothetical protein
VALIGVREQRGQEGRYDGRGREEKEWKEIKA